jgi:hydrogenase expression/formation protein HypE
VVERGKGDGCFITTAGVGVLERAVPARRRERASGDIVLVSGAVPSTASRSCSRAATSRSRPTCAPTPPRSRASPRACSTRCPTALRCLRDATRGGVATVLNEIAAAARVGIAIREDRVPVREPVAAACELLGIDPLHMANEGKLVAVVAPDGADRALAALRDDPLGRDAQIAGHVRAEPEGWCCSRRASAGRACSTC